MKFKRRQQQSGQSIVLVALIMVVLIGFIGLVVDGGRAYAQRRAMDASAEAAAYAGVWKLQKFWDGSSFGTLTDAQVKSYAQSYAGYNTWSSGNGQFYLTYVAADGKTTNDTLTSSARGVMVQLSLPQDASFMRVLGVDKYDIAARATAMFGSAASAPALPLAVNDDAFTPSSFCQPPAACTPAGFQPAGAGGNFGNFNFASIVPPGCAPNDLTCYTNAMRYGSSPPIQVATSYATNSFDKSSLSATTGNALQERINARLLETCTNFTMPSPRVVFLPIANGDIGGATVSLIRFRAVFLTSVTGTSGFSGCFVRTSVSYGNFDPNAVGTGYGGVTIMKLVRSPGSAIPTVVNLMSITSPAKAGATGATISVHTTPGAFYTVIVSDPTPSSNKGLGAVYADASGNATWTWMPGVDAAPPGTYPVDISCSYHALVGRTSTVVTITP
jgi:hypothetical protein